MKEPKDGIDETLEMIKKEKEGQAIAELEIARENERLKAENEELKKELERLNARAQSIANVLSRYALRIADMEIQMDEKQKELPVPRVEPPAHAGIE